MVEFKDECKKQVKDAKIVLEENKARITFINKKQNEYCKINLECVFRNNDAKHCDWLLISENKNEKYCIELKGSDILHGIKQLENTIKTLYPDERSYVFIVFSGKVSIPSFSSQQQKWKKRFKEKLKSTLYIKKTGCEFDLESNEFIQNVKK